MREFRAAVEAGDFAALGDLLADDVVFRSPVAFTPYEGRPIVAAILRGVGRVFTDFRYVRELADASTGAGGGTGSALVFETYVDGVSLHGCDFIRLDDEGRVSELTVMVRPLSAAQALATAMGAQFPQIQAEAMAELTGE
jgi:ketosteroid isomerase-like protein